MDDVRAHGFWKQGTNTIFDARIFNLGTNSDLRTMPKNTLVKSEKENKDKYLHFCLESRHNFNPLVFSDNGIP